MANEIKLKLSVDGSAQVVSEVGRVGDKLRDMDAQARQNAQGVIALRGAFGSLAAVLAGGLSVAGLVAVANKAIDAADAMNDLSQRVGIAVKDLAKYELAASQSGTTMESLAKGIKGLAGNLMEHGDALKKAGITATTADGAMKQLAEVFANMPDGMEKTTLAVKLFGKSGMDLIPMLNMGADGLNKSAEKSAKYAAQMAIMAPLADAYNDNMAEIAMSSKVVGMSIVNDMLPSMVSITGAMAMAAKESGILKAAWVGLGGAMDEFIAKPASVIFKGINNTLDEANAKLMRFFGKTAESDKLLAAVARRNKEILDLTDDASSPAAAASPAAGFDMSKAMAKAMADYKKIRDALKSDNDKKITTKVKDAAKEFKDLNEHVKEFAQANLKALEEDEKAREKYIEGLTKSADSIGEQVQKLRDEEQALGISTARNISLAQALELVAIGRLHEEQAKQMSYGDEAAAAAIQTEIDKRRELLGLIGSKDAREANKKAVDELEKANQKAAEESEKFWTDALMRGFESGKSFFDNFWDTIKNKIKTDVLRVMVQPVAQGITGMMGLSGAANAAGTAGTASGIGTLGSVAAGVSAFGGTLATGFMNTLVGSGMSGGLTAAGAMIANGAWASGLGMAAGALGPIALGIAALSMIGNKDKSTANTGNASARFDASGNRTDYQTYYGGSSEGVDKMLANLQTSYATTAKALGIAAAATQFSYGGNTGKNGESPNFALGGGAGSSKFYQGETASSDAAISLAASRAVFAALQGSDLPAYLAKVFNGVTADALSQEQITGTLAYAASLKQVRDALLETREPLQILKDNVAQGTAALSTSAETFKTDFVAALDSGITPDKLAQWQGLQGAMDQLAQASGKATEAVKDIGRSIADIASERTRLQDQLDELTMTSAQMLDKQRSAIDDSNKSLFDQVQAQIALKDATTEAADAATKAADAAKAAAETYKQAAADRLSAVTGTASDAYAGLERAVAAQRAQEQAATEAQKAIATAAFTSQNELYQKQIDKTKASLDAVGNSVGKLKSLSSSLKSTMDAMRITGSDAAYRAAAQAQIKAAVATARSGGGLPLDGQLQSALSTVSKPSEDLYATFVDYARDFYSTANDISALTDLTDAQLSADEISQALLKDQVDVLEAQKKLLKDGFKEQVSGLDAILANAKQQLDAANGLDTRVLSVAEALKELSASIGQLAGTRASQGLTTTPGVAESRATAIKDYITSAMGGGLSGTALANTIASKAKEVGTTEGEIARAIGWDQSKVREFFAGAGIPQFATGTNYVPNNMLAQIHEGEAIIPKAYNPAAGGSGNSELIAEIRALREEVRQLQQSSSTTAVATKKTAAMIETATEGGRAMLTEVYA